MRDAQQQTPWRGIDPRPYPLDTLPARGRCVVPRPWSWDAPLAVAEPAQRLDAPNHPDIEAAYAAAPSTVVAEILCGALAMSPRPAVPHGRCAKRLGGRLYLPFDEGVGGPGGWIFLDEPELHLGVRPDKMQPDLAGWRRSRVAALPRTPALTLCPDWVCEVLSPSTEATDRGVKLPLYAEHGVSFVWLIDPVARVLEASRLVAGSWRPLGRWSDDEVVRVAPFDALPLALTQLWPE
jgi:Uma2 family endonuclease